MRDPKRIFRLMPKIQTLWLMFPDLRLTQVMDLIEAEMGTDAYYKEDDIAEKAIDSIIQRNS